MAWNDAPRPVRPAEALDTDALTSWLAAHHPDLLTGPISVAQFPAGHSNLTYLLQLGEREVILRRPPFGANIKSAHDMRREFDLFQRLKPAFPRVPAALAFCDDPAVLGADFYLMERLRGVILRASPRTHPPLTPDLTARIAYALIDTLAEIHAVDLDAARLTELGRPEGYARRQIEGWTRRWHAAATDPIDHADAVIAWLAANLPPEAPTPTLLHNDLKHDNVLLDADDLTRVVGVLDWEMATVGDPLMDLGTTLGYWVTAQDLPELQLFPFGPTTLPGTPSRAALVARYAAQTGRDTSHILFYYLQGLFKIAVIIQQIYRRYKLGLTQDPRFAIFIEGVRLIFRVAADAIKRESIEPAAQG